MKEKMSDNALLLNNRELSRFARERSSFYAFLNLHFLMIPDANFVLKLRSSELYEVFGALATDPEIHPELSQGWMRIQRFLEKTRNMSPGDLAQTLGVDRTRLYRGVAGSFGPPPPYEAVWVDEGRDAENVLGRLMVTYRESGLAPQEEYKDRVDYIGTEMDYMRQLASQEAEAWDSGDIQVTMEIVQKETQFINSIREWFSLYTAKAMEFVQTDFYRGQMQMVMGFLADETERLAGLKDIYPVVSA